MFLGKKNFDSVFLKPKTGWRPLWRSEILSLKCKACGFGMGYKTAVEPHKKIHIKLSYAVVCEINRSIGFESIYLPLFYHVSPFLVKYLLQSWCFPEFSKLKTVQDDYWPEQSNFFCDSCFVRLGS